MSNKFSNTGVNFATSSSYKQEEYIRQIVQSEVLLIFNDIKIEIETKIKSIDKSIIELRNEVRKLYQQRGLGQFNELLDRLEKVEAEMQILKYHQQNTLQVSRSKSLDKERKPIFKREDGHCDFSSVVLGLQNDSAIKSQKKILEKREMSPKPPLPKQSSKAVKSQNATIRKDQKQIFNRSLSLDDSGSIHRWLPEIKNRESSCFSSIIREEQGEQSVFYS